jgi:hypothetical protein
MAIHYTGSFIAASCNSRSSHGQVHPVQYVTVTVYDYWDTGDLTSNPTKPRLPFRACLEPCGTALGGGPWGARPLEHCVEREREREREVY